MLISRRRRKNKVKSEVNLTPLIDVMTSLLAIFMITAPLLTTGIPLNLPRGDGKQIQGEDKTLDLGVNEKGEIFVGEERVALSDLLPKVQAIITENPNIKMMISADRNASYGDVIEVMALLRTAGYTEVGLKTDSEMMKAPTPKKKRK